MSGAMASSELIGADDVLHSNDSAAVEIGIASMAGTQQGASGQTGSLKRLGEILVDDGIITTAQLEHALRVQREKQGFLGQILVDLDYVTQDQIVSTLVRQCKIPHLSLRDYEIGKDVLEIIPQEMCLKLHLLPIDKLGRILTIAMVDPLDINALEEVRSNFPDLRIKPILCNWEHFRLVASRAFNLTQSEHGHDDSGPTEADQTDDVQDEDMQAALNAAVEQVIKSAHAEEEHAPQDTPEETTLPAAPKEEAPPAHEEAPPAPMPVAEEKPDESPPVAAPEVQQVILPQDILEVLRQSVREVLSENEATSVAMTNRRELETRAAEKVQRQKHAAGGARGAESDHRVVGAMKSDQLVKNFTFDTFFSGPNNAFTFKLCKAVATKPGADYNPFFLYGDVGLGKTHLVNAIGNAITEQDESQRVAYVSSSRFASRLAEAMHDHAMNVFRENYCHWDVLILDDIQFLGGRIEAQEEFYHIFNVLQQEGRQIIIAGDKPPDHLGLLEQRLVSRFSGGIVANLRPPNWETRVAILRAQMEKGEIALHDDVLALISSRVPNDVRKMIGALRKIMAHAQLIEEEITCEIASDILSHLGFEEAA